VSFDLATIFWETPRFFHGKTYQWHIAASKINKIYPKAPLHRYLAWWTTKEFSSFSNHEAVE